MPYRAIALLAAVGIASGASAQTITSRSWSDPRPGVRLLEGRTSSPTTRFYAVFVDLCADRVHVDATRAPTSRRSAASWGGSVGAQVAVNGDFYLASSPPEVYGQAVGGGVTWPVGQTGEGATDGWYYRRYGWIAFGDGWVDYSHTRLVKNAGEHDGGFRPDTVSGAVPAGTLALVSGFPELVTEGERVTCSSPTASGCFTDRSDMRQRHPRTAMGLTEDMTTFILLVVDGRSTASVGMYGTELASLIHQLGAWQAFNLDGGGSSQMWLEGSGTINSPSDGSPRAVTNHWGVFAGTAGGMPIVPGHCQPREPEDCFERRPDGSGCEAQESFVSTAWLGGDSTSDIDGDGLADACMRGGADFRCRLSRGDAFAAPDFVVDAMSDAAGFDDRGFWQTVRMLDLDGDGAAEVCARGGDGLKCWRFAPDASVTEIDGPDLSHARWLAPAYGATIRVADVNGDHRDDLCMRFPEGIRCFPSTGDGFGAAIDGPAWSDEGSWDRERHFATIRFADVNGDGMDDVCARAYRGLICYPSTGDGFGERFDGPAWGDADGYGAIRYWSTLRMADVDGDGMADACIRTRDDLRCHISRGDSFGPAIEVAALRDGSGWAQHDNYSTLRVGDVDGDGADDLCVKANAGIRCWRHRGGAFEQFVVGPALSDENGWRAPQYYTTIRLADIDGDGRDDLCARASNGLRCWVSIGDGFSDTAIAVNGFDDGRGFDRLSRFATFRVAGPRPVPRDETCNGLDDDLDDATDEGGVCATDAGPLPPGIDDGPHAEAGAVQPGVGGVSVADAGDDGGLDGGCGCRAAGAPSRAPLVLLALLGLGAIRRGR